MIKKTLLLVLVLVLSISTTWSQNLLQHVPKDATFVVTFNPGVLNSKIKIDKLKEFDFVKMGMEEMMRGMGPKKDEMSDIINNPSKYGMDFMSSSYIFGKMEGENLQMSFIFNLSDGAKFTQLIKDQTEGNVPINDRGGYHEIQEDEVSFTWNNNYAIFSGVELSYQDYPDYQERKKAQADKVTSLNADVMKGANRSNSILTHAKFVLAKGKKHDASVWMNYASFMKMYQDMMGAYGDPSEMMMMNMMSGLYEDSYLNMGLNFDKGAMKLTTDAYMNQRMMNISRKIVDAKFNKKFHKYVPANGLLGFFNVNYNLEEFVDGTREIMEPMLNQIPMYGSMINDAIDIAGIVIDEEALYDMWDGDMMLAVTGVKPFKKMMMTYEYDEDFNRIEVEKEVEETLPEFVMMMSYDNKDSWMKIMRMGEKADAFINKGAYFQFEIPDAPMDGFIAFHDGIIFVTNNKDLVQNRLSSGYPKKQRMGKDKYNMLKKNASLFFWDIPKTLQIPANMGMPMDGPEGQMLNISKNSFESIIWKSPKKYGNSINQELSFNFVNKDMNSLEQLFNYINEIVVHAVGITM